MRESIPVAALLALVFSALLPAQRVGEPGREGQASRPEPRFAIRGRVVDSRYEPIAGALVELVAENVPTAKVRSVRTASDGSYFLAGVPLSAFSLQGLLTVSSSGCVTRAKQLLPEWAVDGVLLLDPIQLMVATTFRGMVVDPEGKPISGARLRVGQTGSALQLSFAHLGTSESDFEGRFAISGVPFGKQWLAVLAPGFIGRAEQVEIRDGQNLRVVLQPSERRIPVTIAGEREPWRFAKGPLRIQLWSSDRRAWLPSSMPLQIAKDGTASIPDLEPGAWRAWLVGGPTLRMEAVLEGDVRRVQEIRFEWPDKSQRVLSWPTQGPEAFRPQGFWLSGEDGSLRFVEMGADGALSTQVRSALSYRMLVVRRGARSYFTADALDQTATSALTFSHLLEGGTALRFLQVAPVRGHARTQAGQPAPSCLLRVWVSSETADGVSRFRLLTIVETDAVGGFELPEVEVGAELILQSRDRGWVGSGRLVVQPRQNVVTVTLQPAAMVEGVVTNEEGEPVFGARVVLVPGDDEAAARAQDTRTDREGRYRFVNVFPGRKSLSAGEPQMHFREFVVASGETRRIDMQY